jgi:hypothetical protein
MRDFHAMPLPGPTDGDWVAYADGDGYSHMLSVSPAGGMLQPVFPVYDPDGAGLGKHEYKVVTAGGRPGALYRAGR